MADALTQPRTDRILPIVTGVGLLLIAALAVYLLWPAANPAAQRERVIQQITVLQPPPPPPPPEPEEKIMEEEPEIVQPNDDPKPQADVDKPVETPSDAAPTPETSADTGGVNKDADVGGDSFHLAAGKGGNLFGRGGGGGGGGGGWGTFVETHVRRALQRDPRTRSANGFVRVALNIDGNGRFVGAALRSTTGDTKLDAAIRDVLSGLPPLGRSRPPKVDGVTNATINMKRTAG